MYGIAGLLTGRTLAGRYRIDAVIGRGGMGAVYRATDERLGRAVAVKVIGAVTNDPDEHQRLLARFQREARAAAHIHHPNVVQVFDFGTDPEVGLDYLVMELLQGEDLAVWLARQGPPPVHVAVAILRQAARGLAVGHRAGLVHRDVKPGNVFLEEGDHPGEPRVKLLDFGICAMPTDMGTVTHLTEFGRTPFSPAYASPEQLRGDERVSAASDVFSLGAVGHHLLTGMRAFTSAEPTRMAVELSDSVRRLRERVPTLQSDVYTAVLKALSLNPRDRFADAGAFADALRAPQASSQNAAYAAPGVASAVLAGAGASVDSRTPPQPATLYAPDDDHTQLFAPAPEEDEPQSPARRSFFGFGGVKAAASVEAPPVSAPPPAMPAWAQSPPPVAPPPAATTAPPRDPSPTGTRRRRGFLSALWEFTVTTFVLAMFAGAWGMAAVGVLEESRERLYLGAAATLLLTPAAIHRLTGSRSRFGVVVLAAFLATAGAWRLVGTASDPAILLLAIFGLQVLVCFPTALVFRRRLPTDDPLLDG